MKSIDMCINRFDEDTKASFRDLYAKLDADVNLGGDSDVGDPLANADTTQDAPF